jgi:hypothetical protein
MTDSLQDILSKRNYGEPPELERVRSFVEDVIGTKPSLSMRTNTIFVTVPSAAAAGALRVHTFKIERELQNKYRIVIRIA